MAEDRNFDEIFDKFQNRIKNNKKGLVRGTLIREDILQFLGNTSTPLRILDAGCGLGDLSVWLAELGHHVLAIDISSKMVDFTAKLAESMGLSDRLSVRQASLQDLIKSGEKFDFVCMHAVMEWLAEPYAVVKELPKLLRPGGRVSMTIYNLHRSVFNSLIKGSFRKVLAEDYTGTSNELTPPQPILPEKMLELFVDSKLQLELHAGLRCFYDYFSSPAKDFHSLEDILILERRYRHRAPYRDFARYVHFIAQYLPDSQSV